MLRVPLPRQLPEHASSLLQSRDLFDVVHETEAAGWGTRDPDPVATSITNQKDSGVLQFESALGVCPWWAKEGETYPSYIGKRA